jgi:hypothetical protein
MATNKHVSKIPKFRSEAEEARYWDTHETTDLLDELKPAKLTFSHPKPRVSVSIQIGKAEAALLRQIATRKGLEYNSMIRLWVAERLLDELPVSKR